MIGIYDRDPNEEYRFYSKKLMIIFFISISINLNRNTFLDRVINLSLINLFHKLCVNMSLDKNNVF